MFKNILASIILIRCSLLGIGIFSILLVGCNKEKPAVPKEKEAVPEASIAPVNYLALPNEDWTDRTKERLQFVRNLGDNKSAILSIAVDGTDQRLVVSSGFLDSSGLVSIRDVPRRSPDRRYVAIAGVNKGDEYGIAILDLKNKTGKVICSGTTSHPIWSLDGTTLFFFFKAKEVAYRMASGKIDTIKGDNPSMTGQLGFSDKPQIFGFRESGYVITDYDGRTKRISEFISKLEAGALMGNIGEISQNGNFLATRFYHEVLVVDISHADHIAFKDSLPERAMSLNSDGKIIYYVSSKTVTLIGLNWESGKENQIMNDDVEHVSGLTTLFIGSNQAYIQ